MLGDKKCSPPPQQHHTAMAYFAGLLGTDCYDDMKEHLRCWIIRDLKRAEYFSSDVANAPLLSGDGL